mmetsp:Transcript_27740/g.39009  ORF Transcript_27740/g.39009 Transcript_27740/m.39009 type:complete len:83 (-) Transcript_27740:423-671(-)
MTTSVVPSPLRSASTGFPIAVWGKDAEAMRPPFPVVNIAIPSSPVTKIGRIQGAYVALVKSMRPTSGEEDESEPHVGKSSEL